MANEYNQSTTSDNPNGFPSKGIVLAIGVLLVTAIAVASYAQSRTKQSNSISESNQVEQVEQMEPVNQPETAGIVEVDGMTLEDANASQNGPNNSTDNSTEDMTEIKVVQVEAGSFYFTPNEIRVKKGETVRIEMTSVDMMHNFVIDELEVEIPITTAGNMATVEFTADELGEFEYYCDVADHRAKGQVGMLIVEE